jgi:protein SCO1/2
MFFICKTCLISLITLLLLVSPTQAETKTESKQTYTRSVHNYDVPDIHIVTQNENKVKLSEILNHGGPVFMNFIFTSCNAICPIMTAIFSKVYATIGSTSPDLRFVSVSIDPEHDDPEQLSLYAKKFKAGNNWYFLTGEFGNLQLLQQAFDAYRGDKMNHTSLTLMRASPTSPWIRIEGIASAQDLIREYNILKSPSSLNKAKP